MPSEFIGVAVLAATVLLVLGGMAALLKWGNTPVREDSLPDAVSVARLRQLPLLLWLLSEGALAVVGGILAVLLLGVAGLPIEALFACCVIAPVAILAGGALVVETPHHARLQSIVRLRLERDGIPPECLERGIYAGMVTTHPKLNMLIDRVEDVGYLLFDDSRIAFHGLAYRYEIERAWVTSLSRHHQWSNTLAVWNVRVVRLTYREPSGDEQVLTLIARGGVTPWAYKRAGDELWHRLQTWAAGPVSRPESVT